MNKVVTINLNGNAYQLEEAGYEILRAYLEDAARQLAENPDRDEVIADIEQAIADKCRALLNATRTVVLARDIEQIITEMGPVDDGSAQTPGDRPKNSGGTPPSDSAASHRNTASAGADTGPVKRLYRIYPEGAMLSGVCNGFAAYFGIDATIVRAIFVLLAFVTFGGMALAYVVLVLVLPPARTASEKAAAHGTPSTAQEFIRRAREGYYDATRTFRDKDTHREWKRKFRREARGWSRNLNREMRTHAYAWQASWRDAWSHHSGAYPGLWFTLSLLSIISAAIMVIGIFAFVSLLNTGAIFGIALPAGMPLWVGLLILFGVVQLFLSPIRAVRHSFGRHGWDDGAPGLPVFFGLFDTLLWFAAIAVSIWFIDRHVPQFHHLLQHLRPAFHDAAVSIKDWWARQ